MRKAFSYEIKRHISTISEGPALSLELNLISFVGGAPRFDLRKWRTVDGQKLMNKGTTLSAEELLTLRDVLNRMTEADFEMTPFLQENERG
jgi:hypothetical protein